MLKIQINVIVQWSSAKGTGYHSSLTAPLQFVQPDHEVDLDLGKS